MSGIPSSNRWRAGFAGAFLPLLVVSASSVATAAPEWTLRAGTPTDRDGDGILNTVDGDDDNDLIADDAEGTGDADGDGVPNIFDIDADNDGIADIAEALTDGDLLARLDADGDGILDATVAIGPNGIADIAETAPESGLLITGNIDTDGDGIPDHRDLDSDNDGLADVIEAGGIDVDGDARPDRFRDLDADGRDDQLALFPIAPRDTDGDGVHDFRDTDSDGDGASDRLESSGVDTDGDGVVDGFRDADSDGMDDDARQNRVVPIDSGGDRRPDYLDAGTIGNGTDGGTDGGGGDAATPSPGDPSGTGERPVTGRSGVALGGCSIGYREAASAGIFDPQLLLLMIVALLALTRRRRVLSAAAIGALAVGACTSVPRVANDRSLHAGFGVGSSRLDADLDDTGLVAEERSSTSAQLTVGTRLRPWLDLEFRAADLGEMTVRGGGSIGYQVADVTVVARRHLSSVDVFGRVGPGYLSNDGSIDVDRRNSINLSLGIGLDYPVTSRWTARAELNGHDVDAIHVGIGLVYRFDGWQARHESGAEPRVVESANSPETETRAAVIPTPSPAPAPEAAPAPAPETAPEVAPEAAPTPAPATVPADELAVPSPSGGLQVEPTRRIRPAVESMPTPDDDEGDTAPDVPTSDESAPEVSAPDESTPTAPAPDALQIDDGQTADFDPTDYDLHFVSGMDTLTPIGQQALARLASDLADAPDIRIVVITPVGDVAASDLLSRRRTLAVVRGLGESGVDVSRLRPLIERSKGERSIDTDRVEIRAR